VDAVRHLCCRANASWWTACKLRQRFLSIPKNTWHSFESLTQGLRVLNFYAPAGFERVMIESGTPATSLTLPPDDLPSPDRRLVQRLLDEVGCRLKDYGGPLGGAPGAIRGGTLA